MRLPLALLILLLATATSCSAVAGLFRDEELPLSEADRQNAELYLDLAEEEMEAGELEEAIERLVAVRELANLPPEMRLRSEGLIDRAAGLLLQEADEPGSDPELIADLWELELSPRMRARAGVRYAERLLEAGARVSAYKQIKEVEEELPNHPERARAGSVLTRAGLDLIADPGRYYLIFRYRTKGIAALEFLVLTYPLDPGCPAAYAALAAAYEGRDQLELAIARHEDLIYYHPTSPERIASEAAIPRLRLDRIQRADHDRGEMIAALDDCRRWLERNAGHELEPTLRATEARCRRMLTRNDLYLARYYRRIGNEFGARSHAQRALEEARQTADPDLVAEAGALLDELGPAALGEGGS